MTTKLMLTSALAAVLLPGLGVSADSIMLDLDRDSAPDQFSIVAEDGETLLHIVRSAGGDIRVRGLPLTTVADIRVLPPTDLDGDGATDLVIAAPHAGSGRVWMFSGGANANGILNAPDATITLQSSMLGIAQFGESLGLLPGSRLGAPPCLRVQSLFATRDGTMHRRAEVYRLDTRVLLLVVEGRGPLTDLWADRGDGTRDGTVDATDVPASMARIGTAASYDGDLDGDAIVTGLDVALVATTAMSMSLDAEAQWQSVTDAMLTRMGGDAVWGMPIRAVSAGPENTVPPPETTVGTGVFYCARPLETYESLPWWLSPLCHAYLQIGNWTLGYCGYTDCENINDGRSRKCWEATRASSGSMLVNGQPVDCASATIEQIHECVRDSASAGGVNCGGGYDLICNNCGDWVMNIVDACCLEGSYLPYLIY